MSGWGWGQEFTPREYARICGIVVLAIAWTCSAGLAFEQTVGQPFIVVAPDKKGFARKDSLKTFHPWGANYDHDESGRLLEDYWEKEWPKVESDFVEMRQLRFNVVRIHLQFGKFMDSSQQANTRSLQLLGRLAKLAERERLYLDVTGLGCYHKKDVPTWYDALDEKGRWQAQAHFWRAVANELKNSPAVFCYDLMNEPVVPGGKRAQGEWLGPDFAGKHFVQFITLDQAGRTRPDIARAWIKQLVSAIRAVDQRHLVTVGLVDWSLDRPGLTSGFVPTKVAPELDFLCVHIYPDKSQRAEANATLRGFQVGKPVVVEETFPLRCTPQELISFIDENRAHAAGWISFYWGKPPAELRKSQTFVDALLLQWLELYSAKAPQDL